MSKNQAKSFEKECSNKTRCSSKVLDKKGATFGEQVEQNLDCKHVIISRMTVKVKKLFIKEPLKHHSSRNARTVQQPLYKDETYSLYEYC